MSVVSLEDVRARQETDLGDEALQNVIDQQEADLAAVIGPLVGPRTQRLYVSGDVPLRLRRTTDAVTITDNGIAVAGESIRLLADGRTVQHATSYWVGPVDVLYTPNDEARVRRIVFELVRLELTETGYASESAGNFSYQRPDDVESRRQRLLRSLLAGRRVLSVPASSSLVEAAS